MTAQVRRRALLGEEDRKTASSSAGVALEVGHAVVREDAGQPVAERLGQALPVDVEAVQVGVEVLARAVHASSGALLVGRPVAGQLAQVGEHAEDVELGRERPHPPAASSARTCW